MNAYVCVRVGAIPVDGAIISISYVAPFPKAMLGCNLNLYT
jgi:hypothetical protein